MTSSLLPQPGDMLFFHSAGFVGRMIRLGERLRHPTQPHWVNHVGVCVEPDGDGLPRIVQAGASGVAYAYLKDIDAAYDIVEAERFPVIGDDPTWGLPDRISIVAQAHDLVGAKYGWLTIISIVLNVLTPKWIRVPDFRRGTTYICSAAAAWCLHAGGADIDTYDIYQIMPSELRELAE